jgi:RHS repeat-associated protein
MFTIRPGQSSALRKQRIGDGLARSFEGTKQEAHVDPASGDVIITDPAHRSIRCTFDERGFIGGVSGPLGRTYQLENDPSGRMVGLTTPSGLRLGLDRDPAGRIARVSSGSRRLFDLEYDEASQGLAAVEYPDRTSVRFGYHDAERLSSITDRLGNRIAFAYDDQGRMTSITDPNGRATSFRYGRSDRPDETRFPDGSVETYEYDPAGQVRRIIAGAEPFAEITRDELGRPIEIRYGDGEVCRFAYDGRGNVTEASNPEMTVRYEYDDSGRVVKEDQAGQIIEYQYDVAGDMVGLIYPTGEAVAFHRDAELRLDGIKDWAGGQHRFTYAGEDRGYEHSFPNGLRAEVALAETGQPLAMTVRPGDAAGRAVFSLGFQYDDEDRLRSLVDSDFGARTYGYDVEGRLLEVEAENGDMREVFTYDPAGNRTSRNGTRAEFNALNQLISQGTTRCHYDDRGNLESYDGPQGPWRFVYNRRNLLIRAVSGSGRVVEFGYDAFGRRVWKRSGAKEIRYVWAGEQLIREVETNGPETVARDYLYEPATFSPLAARVQGEIYGYHRDHLGTPRRMTDGLGRVVWSADYRAFGEAIPRIEQVANPWRLPGQYFDEETGLHYNRYRYYAPALGRYLTRDPLSFVAGTNFYIYVDNDPINATDPLGLSWWKTALSIAAAVVVAAVVVVTLPVSLPVAIVAAGAAGGAVGFGLNQALNEDHFCLSCIVKAALKGAAVGSIATLPFVALPAAAGLGAVMGAGAASGGLGYFTEWAITPDATWDWGDFALSVGIGAATAGLGRFLHGKFGRFWSRGEPAPAPQEPAPAPQEPAPAEEGLRPGQFRDANGRLRNADGSFARQPGPRPTRLSRRTEYPSDFRAGVRDEVIQRNTNEQGEIIDPETGEVIPRDQVSIEHQRPVVDHWNEEGYNQSRPERADWYNDTDNLTVMSKSRNSSEGARLGRTYRQDTGPDYSSGRE